MSVSTNKVGIRSLRFVGTCSDKVGIVARVTSYLADQGASITDAGQYHDHRSKTFFMRYVFDAVEQGDTLEAFKKGFTPIASALGMRWQLTDTEQRPRVVFLVSKHDHCLAYLLHRWKVGDLKVDIPCVISNHDAMRDLVEWYGIPYHHVPVPREVEAKAAAFEETARLIETSLPDTIVLARYMQIFPPWLCEKYRYRVINIHHSFLPSFVGAKPYQQAAERGVKLTGATCHYVTEELDAGPIIEQDVVRINHADSLEDMIRKGKDVENMVLARGLRLHLEDRVLVHGNKTIVFT